MHRTLFLIRATYENGVQVDSRIAASEDPRAIKEAIVVAETVAKLEGRPVTLTEQHEVMDRFSESRELVRAHHGMQLRARFNTNIHGPYLLITKSPVADEVLVDWWKASDDATRRAATV